MKIQFLTFILIVSFIGCQSKNNNQQVNPPAKVAEKKVVLSDEDRILQGEIVNGDSANFVRVQIENTIYRMGFFQYEVSIHTPAITFTKGVLQISWENSSNNYRSDDYKSEDPNDFVIYHSLTNEVAHIINVLFYKTNLLPAVKKLELNPYAALTKTNDWGDSKSAKLNLLTAVFNGQTLVKIKEKFDQQKEIRLQRVTDKWAFNNSNVQRYAREL